MSAPSYPLVAFYDVDTGAFDVAADEDSVTIYGRAFFRPSSLHENCPVDFELVLQRAEAGRDPFAFIRFDEDDLRAAGMAYGQEKAEAVLLRALMTPGFQTPGARELLYRELIDQYLPARETTAGSLSFIVTASGWTMAGCPNEERPDLSDMLVYERLSGSEKAKAVACATWSDAVAQLEGYIPDEVLTSLNALAQEQLK